MAITKTEIQSPAIYRITDKVTHEKFYLVKSDSQANTYYQVRWQVNEWQCNCPARKPCKHERAVNEVLKIRRAALAAQMGGETPAIVARMQAREDAKLAAREQDEGLRFNPWHGSNRDGEFQSRKREAYCQEFGIYE